MAKDPRDLDREAAGLLRQVIAEEDFATIPLAKSEDKQLPERPSTLGDAAKIYLDEIERLGVRATSPRIEETSKKAAEAQ